MKNRTLFISRWSWPRDMSSFCFIAKPIQTRSKQFTFGIIFVGCKLFTITFWKSLSHGRRWRRGVEKLDQSVFWNNCLWRNIKKPVRDARWLPSLKCRGKCHGDRGVILVPRVHDPFGQHQESGLTKWIVASATLVSSPLTSVLKS